MGDYNVATVISFPLKFIFNMFNKLRKKSMSITKDQVVENLDEIKKYVQEIEQEKKEVKKVGIQIKNRFTDNIIFESEKTTYKGADLCGANLYGANLYGADLCEANLYEANLRGAELNRALFYGKTNDPKILKENQITDFLTALGFKRE